jgi:hypothetical protein
MAGQSIPYNAANTHNQRRSGHVTSLQQSSETLDNLGVNSTNFIDESSFGIHSRLTGDGRNRLFHNFWRLISAAAVQFGIFRAICRHQLELRGPVKRYWRR